MSALPDLPHTLSTTNRAKTTPPQPRPPFAGRASPAQPPRSTHDLADRLSAISGELDHVIRAARLGRTRRDRDQVMDDIERLAAAMRRSVRG